MRDEIPCILNIVPIYPVPEPPPIPANVTPLGMNQKERFTFLI